MSAEIKTAPFAAPVVDQLAIRVVVDSFYERFIPNPTHPAVAIEYVREIPGRQMSTPAGARPPRHGTPWPKLSGRPGRHR